MEVATQFVAIKSSEMQKSVAIQREATNLKRKIEFLLRKIEILEMCLRESQETDRDDAMERFLTLRERSWNSTTDKMIEKGNTTKLLLECMRESQIRRWEGRNRLTAQCDRSLSELQQSHREMQRHRKIQNETELSSYINPMTFDSVCLSNGGDDSNNNEADVARVYYKIKSQQLKVEKNHLKNEELDVKILQFTCNEKIKKYDDRSIAFAPINTLLCEEQRLRGYGLEWRADWHSNKGIVSEEKNKWDQLSTYATCIIYHERISSQFICDRWNEMNKTWLWKNEEFRGIQIKEIKIIERTTRKAISNMESSLQTRKDFVLLTLSDCGILHLVIEENYFRSANVTINETNGRLLSEIYLHLGMLFYQRKLIESSEDIVRIVSQEQENRMYVIQQSHIHNDIFKVLEWEGYRAVKRLELELSEKDPRSVIASDEHFITVTIHEEALIRLRYMQERYWCISQSEEDFHNIIQWLQRKHLCFTEESIRAEEELFLLCDGILDVFSFIQLGIQILCWQGARIIERRSLEVEEQFFRYQLVEESGHRTSIQFEAYHINVCLLSLLI